MTNPVIDKRGIEISNLLERKAFDVRNRLPYRDYNDLHNTNLSFDAYLDIYWDEDEDTLREIYAALKAKDYEKLDGLYHKLYGKTVTVHYDHPNHVTTLLDVIWDDLTKDDLLPGSEQEHSYRWMRIDELYDLIAGYVLYKKGEQRVSVIDKRGIEISKVIDKRCSYTSVEDRLTYRDFNYTNDKNLSFDEYLNDYRGEDEATLKAIFAALRVKDYEKLDSLYHKLYGESAVVRYDHSNHIVTLLSVIWEDLSSQSGHYPPFTIQYVVDDLLTLIAEYSEYKRKQDEKARNT